jgi:ribonucleoside-triphosphate reductase (formate)
MYFESFCVSAKRFFRIADTFYVADSYVLIMFQTIVKRDGRVMPFEEKKIVEAILKAGMATGEFGQSEADALACLAAKDLEYRFGDASPRVEEVQDAVEGLLLGSRYKKTAKAYIIYRDRHAQARVVAQAANKTLVENYLGQSDWRVKENSNMAYSLQGLNNHISSEVSKSYWLHTVYPESVRVAHESGDLHIHDLNLLSVYCVGWDLYDLLCSGFTGVEGKVSSKPPKHFRSALGQVVNFFYTLQGEAAGAQAFSNVDTLLAPFIRYDGLSYEDVKQAMQEFMFNVNVPTRVGFQTPFTNITLDKNVPSTYADQTVIIGGVPQKETYKEFQGEMDLFNRAFLEVMSEGDASGRVFTFPIPTYNVTKDFDWDHPSNDLLWNVTGKYGLPYFSNFINSDMDPEDARSMCCRLRIDNRELEKRGGGLFGANPLTGSVGVVTINLPRIGYEAKNEEEFILRLIERMQVARESLEIKRKMLETFTDGNLYPYTKFYLRKIKERFGSYWKNHFSTVGIIGMNEAIKNLFGEHVGTELGKAFAERILDEMRAVLTRYQEETGNHYNLEATPAEGTSYRLAMLDRKKCPDCHFSNGRGESVLVPFYTNSTQLPVQHTDDLFEALDLQDSLQTKYTGGTVMHLFLGERIENEETIKNLVRKICSSYRLPYFTFSPTFSVCLNHGYLSGEHPICETCGNTCEIYSRVVGYLRPVGQWNDGKREEFGLRKAYLVPTSI